MTSKPYQAINGKTQFHPVVSEAEYFAAENDNKGFCVACAGTQSGCKPDASKYKCEVCGLEKVYGIQKLLMMGLLILEGE